MSGKRSLKPRVVEAVEVEVAKEDEHRVTQVQCIVSCMTKVLVIQLKNVHML